MPTARRIAWACHGLLAVTILFLLSPAVDIAVSGLFHDPGRGFHLIGKGWAEGVRFALWRLSILVFLVALLWPLLSFWAGRGWTVGPLGPHLPPRAAERWRAFAAGPGAQAGRVLRAVPGRVWGFAAALYLLGPGLMVNIILKENWGRVRPTGIEAFGGPHPYTPPFQIPGACAENCSFVSGEGSGSMATALVFVAIAAHLPRPAALLLIGFGAAVAVVGGGLRVAMGGHFLSDVLIGAILTYILAEALARPILGAPLGYRAASPRQPAPTATI